MRLGLSGGVEPQALPVRAPEGGAVVTGFGRVGAPLAVAAAADVNDVGVDAAQVVDLDVQALARARAGSW